MKDTMNLDKYSCIIFDLDGTLQDRDTLEILPGVVEFFERLPSHIRVGIATNQGGVGYREYKKSIGTLKDSDPFPDERSVASRIRKLIGDLGENPSSMEVEIAYRYQTKDGKWLGNPPAYINDPYWKKVQRKPSPMMLLRVMSRYDTAPEETLMVGDGEEDQEAARRAGCDFVWADEFFGRSG